MSKKINISDSEKFIMDILWHSSPQTSKQIISSIDSSLEWQDKTIKTLINRLLKKEAINFEKQGRQYLYFPLIKEADYIQKESQSFVQKVFKGDVGSLISAFAKPENLSSNDIQKLKEIIANLSDKKDEE